MRFTSRLGRLAWLPLTVLTFALLAATPALADDELPPAAEDPATTESLAEAAVQAEQGESAPPAAEQASEVAPETDPMWCPAGVTPGSAACTIDHPTFAALLGDPIFAGGGPSVGGVIWVRDNYLGADAANIHINGATLTNTKNYALTIRGGWTGIGTAVNTTTPSWIDVSLTISGWNAAVTLKDLSILGAASNPNCTSPAALCVTTTKLLTLERVRADDSGGGLGGAFFDYSTTPGVVIKSSTFSNNASFGLTVQSHGPITLSDVTASGNLTGHGALLTNGGAPAPMNVILNGTNRFDDNGDFGLKVDTTGAISIRNVLAGFNENHGVWLVNSTGAAARAITISGFVDTTDNDGRGLHIDATGVVTLNNVNSRLDGGGAWIDNSHLPGAAAPGVYLRGMNAFQQSGGTGLFVRSDGPIALNQVSSIASSGLGVQLDNTTATTPQNVSITGFLKAQYNAFTGVLIQTDGAVSAANLTASSNDAVGASIHSYTLGKPITLTGRSLFDHNAEEGLKIGSLGPVTLNNVMALWNGCDNWAALPCASAYDGVVVNNSSAPAGQPPVTVLGENVFEHNSYQGLGIVSLGTITVYNISAVDNLGNGAALWNPGVGAARPVLVYGVNLFNNNGGGGLKIDSSGAITVSKVTSIANAGDGVALRNSYGTYQGNVSVTGYGVFHRNDGTGLEVLSHGAFSGANLAAERNAQHGVYIDTQGLTGPKSVNIAGVNTFSFNGTLNVDAGLYVLADGNISLNNVTSSWNWGGGAVLNNFAYWGPFAPGSVTISSYGMFYLNGGDGLVVASPGNVLLNRVHANLNNGVGIYVDTQGNLTIVCALSTLNASHGIDGDVDGNLIIKGLSMAGNGGGNTVSPYVVVLGTTYTYPCP